MVSVSKKKKEMVYELLDQGITNIDELVEKTGVPRQSVGGIKGQWVLKQKAGAASNPKPPDIGGLHTPSLGNDGNYKENDDEHTGGGLEYTEEGAEFNDGGENNTGIPQYTLSHTEKTPLKQAGFSYDVKPSSKPPSSILRHSQPTDRSVTLVGDTIGRTLALSPKVHIWFDWYKSKPFKDPDSGGVIMYDGNFADFLEECVEDFFKRRGWKIVIRREDEVLEG